MPDGITLSGFDEYVEKVRQMPATIQREVDMEVLDAAREWEKRAKQSAPVDHGFLQGGIHAEKIGMMQSDITSNAQYSAYVEWGTGTKVSVPADLTAYALGFKGAHQVIGMTARPFFFIHMEAISQLLMQRLNKVIENV